VWHEVPRDAIVRAIKQNFHSFVLLSRLAGQAGSDIIGFRVAVRSDNAKTEAILGTAESFVGYAEIVSPSWHKK